MSGEMYEILPAVARPSCIATVAVAPMRTRERSRSATSAMTQTGERLEITNNGTEGVTTAPGFAVLSVTTPSAGDGKVSDAEMSAADFSRVTAADDMPNNRR